MSSSSTIPLTWVNPPEGVAGHSSQIHAYGYDAATQQLAVEYHSNHERMTYHYLRVPQETFAGLEAAESKGSFIYRNVKGKFEYAYKPKATEQQTAAEG